MISRLVAAAVAVTALTMPAHAYPVQYTADSVSLAFADKISNWVDAAPARLRARIGKPDVFALQLEDYRTMPQAEPIAFKKGARFYGQAIRIPGRAQGRLVFIEQNMNLLDIDRQYRIVLHEMMHLYDFEAKPYKSVNKGFVAAFKQDIADILGMAAVAERESPDTFEVIQRYVHYMQAPKEAFAEAGANLIAPKPDTTFRLLFPNVTAHVHRKLMEDGIIGPQPAPAPAQPTFSTTTGASSTGGGERVWPSQQYRNLNGGSGRIK